MTIAIIMLLLALVCLVCAALGVNARQVNLIAAGLAFYILSLLLG